MEASIRGDEYPLVLSGPGIQYRATVLVGFLGVGKTSFMRSCKETGGWLGREVIDFNPCRDSCSRTGASEVEFWNDCFCALRTMLAQDVVLLLPACRELQGWLVAHGVLFVLVVPDSSCGEEWIRTRVRPRYSSVLAGIVDESWHLILDDCCWYAVYGCCILVELGAAEFLDRGVVSGALLRLFLLCDSQWDE